MSAKPLTFIIMLHDGVPVLRRCIAALNQQTFTGFEIVVSDATSTGYSNALNRKLCPGRECIRYVNTEPGQSLWQRIKDAVGFATGEYIIFINTSQWLDNSATAILYEAAGNNGVDLAEIRTARCIKGMTVRNDNPIIDPALADRVISGEELRQIGRFIGQATAISPSIYDKIFRRDLLIEAMQIDFPGHEGCNEILTVQYIRHTRSIMLLSFAGVNYNWQETEESVRYIDLQEAKLTYTYKILSGQDAGLARQELDERLHNHVVSLVRDMGWTREATTFFIGEELNDSFWRNAGIDVTIDELMQAVYARNLHDDIVRIARRLLR